MLNILVIRKALRRMEIENKHKAATFEYYDFVSFVLTAHVALSEKIKFESNLMHNSMVRVLT